MKVPTIQSDASIRTSDFNVVASPESFAPIQGLSALSRGVSDAAGNIGQIAEIRNQVKKNKQREDAVVWASKSIEQEKRFINEWMADPENNSKETFAQDLLNLAEKRKAAYSKAPSTIASRLFNQHFDSFITASHDSALGLAERTRLNNRVDSFSSQFDDALQSYRAALKVPGVDGGKSLLGSLSQIGSSIDATFGRTAPNLARKLKDQMVENAAYATMDTNPGLAHDVLDTSKTLDEHTRWTILNHIEEVQKSRNVDAQLKFDNLRDSVRAVTRLGQNQDKIPIEEYRKFYPDPQGTRLKAEDDAYIDRFNMANDFMAKHEGDSAPYLMRAVNDLKNGITDSKALKGDEGLRADVYALVARKAQDLADEQAKDPVGWMVKHHPLVKGAYRRAADALSVPGQGQPSDAERADLYDSIIRFQGPPPPGTKPEQAALYLSRPKHDIHLMDVGQAEQAVQAINDGAPSEVIDNVNRVLGSYQGEKYQGIAFNDLVTLPKDGLKQEYQFAFLNRNEPWIKFYLGSLQNSKALEKVTPEQRAKFEESLDANPLWMQFSRTLTRDNLQRLNEVDGFKRGIMNMAMARSFQYGENFKQAIDASTKQLIGSNLGMASVNGVPLFLPKERPDHKGFRTDEEIADIGRRLEDALVGIDVRQFKMTGEDGRDHWPQLKLLPNDSKRDRALMDDIMAHGFFQPSPDGQSLTLYYHNGAEHFEIRDKNNRAFEVHLEDLPMFEGPGIPGNPEFGQPARPSKLYKKDFDAGFLWGSHWPMYHYHMLQR